MIVETRNDCRDKVMIEERRIKYINHFDHIMAMYFVIFLRQSLTLLIMKEVCRAYSVIGNCPYIIRRINKITRISNM